VTVADVSAAATLYYTPYLHDRISLYDGVSWRSVSFTEKSLSLAGYTASKPYDIWGYLNAGTLALESTIWTDGTTRATALAYQNGRLVKNGDATRRYLGAIYINSSGAQTDESVTSRFVSNYYNRVARKLLKRDATAHTVTTGWRSWNNDAALRVQVFVGVQEDPLYLSVAGEMDPSSAGVNGYVGLGFDITNNVSEYLYASNSNANNARMGNSQSAFVGLGYHYIQIVQLASANVTFNDAMVAGHVMG